MNNEHNTAAVVDGRFYSFYFSQKIMTDANSKQTLNKIFSGGLGRVRC
jgi:hypothetical protein